MTENYHRKKFDEVVNLKMKNPQCRVWTKFEIQKKIDILNTGPKTKRDERSVQSFHLIGVSNVKELRYIDPYSKVTTNRSLIVVPFENLFDKINWCWEQTGYGGWNSLHTKIREQGYFINIELIKIFLSQSPAHQGRIMKKSQKSLVTKPILSDEFGARGQVDLIDMRSNPDGEYNWILNYQDHFTKWIVLRPLKRKCAVEVASTLVSVFYTLGAPCILQSDNGKEFDNNLLLVTLNQLWPSTKIIHGKPRHPQSQGSVESANKRVENILTSLLDKFQHSNWASELEKVAYMKNTTVHSVCKNSPYRILYNRDPPRGLRDFHLPEELHHSINDVEDIKALNSDLGNEPGDQLENNLESHSDTSMMKEEYDTESDSDEYDIEMNIDAKSLGASVYTLPDSTTCKVCKLSVGGEKVFCDGCSLIGHKHCFNTLSPLRGQSRKYTYCKKLQCTGKLQHKQTQLAVQRAQKVQADKMLLNTALTLPPLSIGDNVRVPIPKVDKGKLGPNHILGVITKVSNNSYRIGTEKGILDRNYSRGEIALWTDSSYLSVQDIPTTEIKMHTIANLLSRGRKNKCLCRGNCATKHCPCKVSGCYCTSGCHPKSNSTCKNSDNKKALLESHKLKSKVTSTIRKKSPKKSHSSSIPLDEVINKNIQQKSFHCYSLNVHLGEIPDLAPSLSQLEPLCVVWGGEYNGTQLINTCSIDNFLTLISLQIDPIRSAFGYLQKELGTEVNELLTKIQLGKFDLLRYSLSKEMEILENFFAIDFYGSEYTMVKYLTNIGLSCMKYQYQMKCSGCSQEISKIINVTTFDKFTNSCQITIESKITTLLCKICKRQNEVIQLQGDFIQLSPLLILELGNLKVLEEKIEEKIHIIHQDKLQHFKLLGYTLLFGNHFTLKTFIGKNRYHYDGMKNKKIISEEDSNQPRNMEVNFAVYLAIPC